MTLRNLTPLEVRDLISRYQSDLRKLEYQIHKVHQILEELQGYAPQAQEKYIDEPILRGLPSAEASEEKGGETTDQEAPQNVPTAKGRKTRRGRPKKMGSDTAPGKVEGSASSPAAAEPKVEQGKGYRLSEWDLFVVNCLLAEEQSLITSDFLVAAENSAEITADAKEIKIKLNRSLHKLANKKGILVKVEYSGRGYAYALAKWLNSKGELPKKYAR